MIRSESSSMLGQHSSTRSGGSVRLPVFIFLLFLSCVIFYLVSIRRVTIDNRRFLAFILIWILTESSPVVLGDKSDIKLLTPTTSGSTGLFTLPVAETLRQGEFSIGLNSFRFNRDPGALRFTIFPVSFSVGLHDRVEVFGSFEAYKQLQARDVQTNKTQPGGILLPAQVASVGRVGYFNDSPLVDVSLGDGLGELWAGAKFNLLSERDIGCLSLALQPVIRIPTSRDSETRLLGLTAGRLDTGLDVIASKNIGKRTSMSGRLGLLTGRDVEGANRQHQLNWGVGIEWQVLKRSMRVIAELVGNSFIGNRPSTLVNSVSPLDSNTGIRIRLFPWLTVSGALNLHWKNSSSRYPQILPSKRLGWVFQAALQKKVNRPPMLQCRVSGRRVREGKAVTVFAILSDPDDDALWLSWKSNGGRLTQKGTSVVLDTTGMEPGRYSVKAEVGDDASVASCSVDIEIVREE